MKKKYVLSERKKMMENLIKQLNKEHEKKIRKAKRALFALKLPF